MDRPAIPIANVTATAPLVSVVLPVFNGETYVSAAMESVLGQTFTDFELIVIDDGSRDRSPEIIAGYDDPRVVIVTHSQNAGLVDSLNEGLRIARGQLVARIDADDTCVPTRFSRQVQAFLDNPDLVLTASAYRRIDPSGAVIRRGVPPQTHAELTGAMLAQNRICHSSVMFRRAEAIAVGGYRADEFPVEDYGMWLRLCEVGMYVGSRQVEVDYLDNPAGISMTQAVRQQHFIDRMRLQRLHDLSGRPVSDRTKSTRLVRAYARAYRRLRRDLSERGIDRRGLAASVQQCIFGDLLWLSRRRRIASAFLFSPALQFRAVVERRPTSESR
jgi:glycosyltransferase involved in cell wall biosynthesis